MIVGPAGAGPYAAGPHTQEMFEVIAAALVLDRRPHAFKSHRDNRHSRVVAAHQRIRASVIADVRGRSRRGHVAAQDDVLGVSHRRQHALRAG